MSKRNIKHWLAIFAIAALGIISISLIAEYEDIGPASYNGYHRGANAQANNE